MKINLPQQNLLLQQKVQDGTALIDDIRQYLKKRCELEAKQLEEQQKLAALYLTQRKKSKYSEWAISKPWITFLEQTIDGFEESKNKCEELRETLKAEVVPNRDLSEHAWNVNQSCQTELVKSFTDLESKQADYEKAQKSYNKAKKNMTEVSRQTLNVNKIGKAAQKKESKSRSAQDARNEYLLSLEAGKAIQHQYFSETVPLVLEGTFLPNYDVIKNAIDSYLSVQKQLSTKWLTRIDTVKSVNDALDVQKDTHRFLNENAMHFSEPEAPRFEIYEGDDESRFIADNISKTILNEKSATLQEALEKTKIKFNAVSEAQSRVSSTNANNLLHEDLKFKLDLSSINMEKARIEAQINLMSDGGVSLDSRSSKKEETRKRSLEAGFMLNDSKQRRCIAVYDFAARTEHDLTIKEGDIIQILFDGDEWTQGKLRGKVGLFPRAYVKSYYEDEEAETEVKGNSKCIALYNYDGGSIHDQLNLIEGEELTVIEKGPEWTKGQKGDRIGFFPTSYVEFYN